jgi:hypothetical protein
MKAKVLGLVSVSLLFLAGAWLAKGGGGLSAAGPGALAGAVGGLCSSTNCNQTDACINGSGGSLYYIYKDTGILQAQGGSINCLEVRTYTQYDCQGDFGWDLGQSRGTGGC